MCCYNPYYSNVSNVNVKYLTVHVWPWCTLYFVRLCVLYICDCGVPCVYCTCMTLLCVVCCVFMCIVHVWRICTLYFVRLCVLYMYDRVVRFILCVCVYSPVRRLLLCEELDRSSCGSVLFHGYLPPPGTGPITSAQRDDGPIRVLGRHLLQ